MIDQPHDSGCDCTACRPTSALRSTLARAALVPHTTDHRHALEVVEVVAEPLAGGDIDEARRYLKEVLRG